MPTKEEKNMFSLMIEATATREGITHMEAITDYCSKTGLEVEVAAQLINGTLKSKIELEARTLRYLPKNSTLPVD
jgi:hypothetical protein